MQPLSLRSLSLGSMFAPLTRRHQPTSARATSEFVAQRAAFKRAASAGAASQQPRPGAHDAPSFGPVPGGGLDRPSAMAPRFFFLGQH